MRKTFYSVTYRAWGADSAREAWFDNKEQAEEFANQDHHDKAVRHTFSNAAKIADAEQRVKETKLNLA